MADKLEATGYVKGMFDRGELADKFVAIVVFDELNDAILFEKTVEDQKVSVHQVYASAWDIDYDVHKISMSPFYKKFEGHVGNWVSRD